MAELVDAADSKSAELIPRGGSIPPPGTTPTDMAPLTPRDFGFDLPEELIAQAPAPTERAAGCCTSPAPAPRPGVSDLPRWSESGDLLVFNDTRVIKSRVAATKPTGGEVEMLVERSSGRQRAVRSSVPATRRQLAGGCICRADARPRCRAGRPVLEPAFAAPPGRRIGWSSTATCRCRPTSAAAAPGRHGAVPDGLRPRTRGGCRAHRGPALRAADAERRLPTGIELAWLTLHVGAGTFAPVQRR